MAVLCSVMAFPAFAETVEIDGYTFNKVTFTAQDLQNLITGGFLNVSATISVSSGSVRVYDLSSDSYSTVRASSGDTSFNISYATVTDDFTCFFYSPYVINVNASNSKYTIAYNFTFSFDGYIYNDSSFISEYYVGDSGFSDLSQTIRFLTLDNDTLSYSSTFLTSASDSWSDSDAIYLQLIKSMFSNDPTYTGKPYRITYTSSASDLAIPVGVTQITFSESSNISPGYSYSQTQSPLAFALKSFTFYELVSSGSEDPDNPGTEDPDNPGTEDPDNPGTEDPDTPTTGEITAVLNYLSVPSEENLQVINDIRAELEEVKQQLANQSNDLIVDVPSIEDVTSDLPTELEQGNEVISEQALTPLLNLTPVVTIFGGVFVIVALKLFLFGSGPH